MKKTKFLLMITAMMIFIISMAFVQTTKITVKGSDTMVILSQQWSEIYMKENPNVSIQVTGGGSGIGIAALINGTTDIANSSRPIKSSEVEKLKARYNTLGVQIPCAKDGITIYLNEANKVEELTLQQISDIYQAKITNWKQYVKIADLIFSADNLEFMDDIQKLIDEGYPVFGPGKKAAKLELDRMYGQNVIKAFGGPIIPSHEFKNYDQAILNFQEIIDKYPKSEKAPRALLSQAEAFRQTNDKKSSITILKRVIELYPKTEEAVIAERKLRNSSL